METYSDISARARKIVETSTHDEIRALAELIVKLCQAAEDTNTVARDAQQTARYAESIARSK